MITRTEKESNALIRTHKLNEINKKFNNEEVFIKTENSIRVPWFCPKCKKMKKGNINDYSLLTDNMCLECAIRIQELNE